MPASAVSAAANVAHIRSRPAPDRILGAEFEGKTVSLLFSATTHFLVKLFIRSEVRLANLAQVVFALLLCTSCQSLLLLLYCCVLQAGGRPGSLGSPSLDPGPGSPARPAGPDSYGAPQVRLQAGRVKVTPGPTAQLQPLSCLLSQARPIAAAPTDSYGAPEAAPISTGDSYGAPAAAPVTAGGDSYGSPAASPVTGGGEELLAAVGAAGLQPQYGAGALNTYASPGAEPIISDNSDTAAPAIDSYGGAVGPVVSLPNLDPSPAAAPAPDSYGGAVAPVLEAAPAPAYDDYDPSDIPADQAAPVITDNAAAPAVDIDDYDPSDIPADQAEPLAGYGRDAVDVYGSALAPVGTSAPGEQSTVSRPAISKNRDR